MAQLGPDMEHHVFARGNRHLTEFPLTRLSVLAPFGALMMSIILIIYFLIRYYILENFLLRRVYGKVYTDLDDRNRRGFLNHHIAGCTKILILFVAAYPFISVAFRDANFQTPFARGSPVKMGDMLVVAAQMLMAMYMFELLYRPRISPVSVIHHIGTIMIGQSAIAINLNAARQEDAGIEFVLCTVWGAFDIVAEFLPHVAMIYYRVLKHRHILLRNMFIATSLITFASTIFETAVVMYMFGVLWYRWSLAFKIVTPILHVAFAAAQLHGSRILFLLYRKQCRFIARDREAVIGVGDVGVGLAMDESLGEKEVVAKPIVAVQSV
ncbi:MAG: hypothetical protein M1833_005529 [Piccolia ochrophora]|nr:MAG: hypothetical protein M1833_005529 [Piccolia ochrophora]